VVIGEAALLRVIDAFASPRRRELLQLAFASAVVGVLGCRRASQPEARRFVVLDAAEAAAIEAATARILPSEPDFAGAREAEVVGFVDRQLATPDLAPAAAAIRALAKALDASAAARGAATFAAASPAQQDAILDDLASGRLADARALPQAPLFALLHTLTLEGFLADPRHGGNAGESGWRAIGFLAPPDPHHHHR
jgi:gluconate 2-dehydrogenase gamma chain